ncbi:MAG: hypothetical protein FJZ92_08015 [Chloroflexi bacterium]|nr:hypothetical protein [Chloroflexota bacterium]
MPRWLLLPRAEALRTRALISLARGHPALPIVFALAVAVLTVPAARVGTATGRAADAAPIAGVVATVIVIAAAALLGLASSRVVPRFADFDEQLQLLPLSRAEMFLGVTAVPLAIGWALATLPLSLLLGAMYVALDVELAVGWAFVSAIVLVWSATAGAGIAEACASLGRGRATSRWTVTGLGVLLAAIAAAPGVALGRPPWLSGGALLPTSAGSPPPIWLSGLAATALATASFLLWVRAGSLADVARGRSGAAARFGSGWGHRLGRAWWWVATIARDRRLRFAALAPVCVAAALLVLDRLLDAGTGMSMLAALCAVVMSAQVALVISGAFSDGLWLWRMLPAPARAPGPRWWSGANATVLGLASPALALILLLGSPAAAVLVMMLTASASAAAISGFIIPWADRAIGQQFAQALAYFALLSAAVAAHGRLDAALHSWLATAVTSAVLLALAWTTCARVRSRSR